ncbi:MBL fold metallo-hydrolase [Massilia sp. YIM B02443]|uniref:MBL fold metallo-hydrolase n=1 Tax=Massilia sp. YIM B02443 TaxID=3050127 RepID=UPI0025B6720B|nr:MBL fold metallo-hydrolase [Massilia sp. YIM B02443]MDN4037601.1 MBL fold metallo-hydrolase [Massilia sp. YIM B02443]
MNERRRLLLGALLPLTLGAAPRAWCAASMQASTPAPAAAPDRMATALEPWQPGWLDIHHIATGRGNATFVMLPDGTSMLIDAGASLNALDVSMAPRPDATRRAGEWIGRYARRHLVRAGLEDLDYLLVTHLHPDHTGDVEAASPPASGGAYRLSGVTDVAAQVPIGTVVDRGYPDYDFPLRITAPFADNYRAFIAARRKSGQRVEAFQVGSNIQFAGRGRHRTSVPFEVRNIAASGEVWTGEAAATRRLFPPLAPLARAD